MASDPTAAGAAVQFVTNTGRLNEGESESEETPGREDTPGIEEVPGKEKALGREKASERGGD